MKVLLGFLSLLFVPLDSTVLAAAENKVDYKITCQAKCKRRIAFQPPIGDMDWITGMRTKDIKFGEEVVKQPSPEYEDEVYKDLETACKNYCTRVNICLSWSMEPESPLCSVGSIHTGVESWKDDKTGKTFYVPGEENSITRTLCGDFQTCKFKVASEVCDKLSEKLGVPLRVPTTLFLNQSEVLTRFEQTIIAEKVVNRRFWINPFESDRSNCQTLPGQDLKAKGCYYDMFAQKYKAGDDNQSDVGIVCVN